MGHSVIGVELSELACNQFFSENKIPFKRLSKNGISIFESEHVTIFNCDFFMVGPEHLGEMGAVYDRAALIALPQDIRLLYATQIKRLVRACSKSKDLDFLQIVLERTPHDNSGPPFSVSESELENLYGRDFTISRLSRDVVKMNDSLESTSYECIYRLTLIL